MNYDKRTITISHKCLHNKCVKVQHITNLIVMQFQMMLTK